MMNYKPVTEEVLEALRKAVGAEYVMTDPETLDKYKTDEETDPHYHHLPEVVVMPANTEEVAAVMKIANEFDVPVTPRSAGTSVSCGAVPVCGGIVLLMERMDKILELNKEGMYMVVEAGARTLEIQEYANKEGFLYAGDPCSADSCLIGGNIATNAGGNKAVRYGTTRNQVYSVEVVTPTGDIVTLGSTLKKNSTGYCLEQLVMGSEGTLGIITKATLKLLPLCPYKLDILAIFTELDKAIGVVPNLIKAGLNPTSVEFMDNGFVRSASDYCELKLPHYEDGYYVIITVETFNEEELESKMEQLDEICTESGIAECIEHLNEVSKKYSFKLLCLAHAGDGNLHFQILKCDLSEEEWEKQLSEFHAEAYAYVYSLGGRLSGEHGIGAKKLPAMEKYTDPVEMKMMRAIKAALDPKGILNPGKVFNVR